MISAMRKFSLRSVSWSAGNSGGDSGRCLAITCARCCMSRCMQRRHRHDLGKGVARRQAAPGYGSNFSRGFTVSTLFTTAMTGRPDSPARCSASSSSAPKRSASTTNTIRSASSAAAAAVRFMARFSARPAWRCRPGVSTKAICASRQVHQAQHPMPGGLRLGADDGHLVPDQCIEQRGLADIGAADQRGKAAAVLRSCAATARCSCSSTPAAASCSARRRLEPAPSARSSPPLRQTHLAAHGENLLVRLAGTRSRARSPAAPRRGPAAVPAAGSWHPSARPPACSSSSCSPHTGCRISSRAASTPPSRYTAPNSASVASARMDSRRKPPERSSPLPRRSMAPMPMPSADRGQRPGADQPRAQAAQDALAGRRKTAEQLLGDHHARAPHRRGIPAARCCRGGRCDGSARRGTDPAAADRDPAVRAATRPAPRPARRH